MSQPSTNPGSGPAKGFGKIFSVRSGDEVQLISLQSNGPPQTKIIQLVGVQAPAMGMKSLSYQRDDEPGGFLARESLRELAIGRTAFFLVDYTRGSKSYGDVWLTRDEVRNAEAEKEASLPSENPKFDVSLAAFVLNSGWGKYLPNDKISAARSQVYSEARERAESKRVGLWQPTMPTKPDRIVSYILHDKALAAEFSDKHMNQKLPVIIEHVSSGHMYNAQYIVQDNEGLQSTVFSIQLSGVVCDLPTTHVDDGTPNCADESKLFVELRILNRKVFVTILGCNSSGCVCGTVTSMHGKDLGVALVEQGLGLLNYHSISEGTNIKELQEAESKARLQKIGKHRGMKKESVQHESGLSTNQYHNFIVLQVVSPTCYVITPPSGVSPLNDLRVYLASVKAPKKAADNEVPYLQQQGKEFIRKQISGKTAKIKLAYTRDAQREDSKAKLYFVDVIAGDKSINELVVKKGYAEVLAHRPQEPHSEFFAQMVLANKAAQEAQIGIYSTKQPLASRIIDLTSGGTSAKQRSKFFLDKLVDAGKILCFVEHVVIGHKVKLFYPQDNLYFNFIMEGIRAPASRLVSRTGKMPAKDQPDIGSLAISFLRKNILDQQVKIQAKAVDRGGNFIGTLMRRHVDDGQTTFIDVALELLTLGYATVSEFSPVSNEMQSAVNQAKSLSLGIWALEEYKQASQQQESLPDTDYFVGTVSQIQGVNDFFMHREGEKSAELRAMLEEAEESLVSYSALCPPPVNSMVVVKDSELKKLFRGKLTSYNEKSETGVFVDVDSGFSCTKPIKEVYYLPNTITAQAVPPLAVRCSLYGCEAPPDEEIDAIDYFAELALSRTFQVTVMGIDAEKRLLVILDRPEGDATSINAELISVGAVIVNRTAKKSHCLEQYQLIEEKARKTHAGCWRYGDIIGCDD